MFHTRLARLACAAVLACGASAATATAASAAGGLQGAGSTLIAPLEQEWGTAWASQTGNPIPSYQAVGSGKGLSDIAAGLVDFGASDAPLSASTTTCTGCVQLPWGLSATGIGFNIPGIHKLHLTGKVLAEIYLGQITKWNNKQITKLNKGEHLPNLTITPLHRSDGSGDSYAFTDYLTAVSSQWSRQVSRGTKPAFPVGPGAQGNSGMVQVMGQTRGAIAYIAVSYLLAKHLPAAALENRAGNFEVPNYKNIANAAGSVHSLPANNEIHIVNPPKSAKIAYPLSTFTYVLLRPSDPFGLSSQLHSFVQFALTTGQSFGPSLDFVKLLPAIVNGDLATLNTVH